MKKEYGNPNAVFVKFRVRDIVITSGEPEVEGDAGIGDFDGASTEGSN